jgi:hypothetical protein
MEEWIEDRLGEIEEWAEGIPEEIGEFIQDNLKQIIIFLMILILLGGTLIAINQDVKKSEKEAKEQSANAISNAFQDTSESLTENISDPSLKNEIKFLWWLAGFFLVLAIIIMIGKAFKPLYDAIDPWQMAGRISK